LMRFPGVYLSFSTPRKALMANNSKLLLHLQMKKLQSNMAWAKFGEIQCHQKAEDKQKTVHAIVNLTKSLGYLVRSACLCASFLLYCDWCFESRTEFKFDSLPIIMLAILRKNLWCLHHCYLNRSFMWLIITAWYFRNNGSLLFW
jgi:hypothetical protein